MPKSPLVLVLGDINRDLFLKLDRFPRPGGDYPALGTAWALGGSAVNTASMLVRLGVSSGVIGRVGRDTEGRALVREMRRLGIHTSAIEKDPARGTGICIIPVTSDGERTLIGWRGANRGLRADRLPGILPRVRHLHVDGYALIERGPRRAALRALRQARQAGATTSVDFGWQAASRAPQAIRQALAWATVALPSDTELCLALGGRSLPKAAARALTLGVEQVAATMGAKGCTVFDRARTYRIPACDTIPFNTTGAGDGFNAGYIFGLIEGAVPSVCGVLANAVGAMAVRTRRPDPFRSRDLIDTLESLRGRRPAWLRASLDEALGLIRRQARRQAR